MNYFYISLAVVTLVHWALTVFIMSKQDTGRKAVDILFWGFFWPLFHIRAFLGMIWAIYRYISKKG